MSWKNTVLLAALTAAAFIAWVAVRPAEDAVAGGRARPFEYRETDYQQLTIRVPGEPEIAMHREKDKVLGSFWHLDSPLKRPADDGRAAEMIGALRKLTRDSSIKPGDAAYNLATYGLDKPSVVVTVKAGEERTVKFGNVSNRDPDTRYFMVEGEPEIFMGPADSGPPFLRKVSDLRTRYFLAYEPSRVRSFELSRRFLKAGSDRKLAPEFDTFRFEFKDKASATGSPGWYITRVNKDDWNEKADDTAVSRLISGLRNLSAEEFMEGAKPEECGLDSPTAVIRFDILQSPGNETRETVVEIGKIEEKGSRKLGYLRVDRGTEIVAVNGSNLERLPMERKDFLARDLFDFPPFAVETIEMTTATGHRILLGKTERDEMQGPQKVKIATFFVAEPANYPAEKGAVDDFVATLLKSTWSDVLGSQPDLSSFGLDKPALVLTLKIKSKTGEISDRVYKFGCLGDSKIAYLIKPGSKEIYQVSEEIWRRLDRTDLNFRQLKMFDVSRDQIAGVSFDYRPDRFSANAVRYSLRRGEGGAWEFDDPANMQAGVKVDKDRMDQVLGALNFVKAEGFLTRNPRIAKEYKLDLPVPQGRLVIRYSDPAHPGKAAEKVFRLSEPYTDPSGRERLYYCRVEAPPGDTSPSSDATIIFRIRTDLVEILRQGVVYEQKGDPGIKPGEK